MRILCFTTTLATLFFAGYGEASSIFLDLGLSEKRCIADSVRKKAETTFSFRVAKGHPVVKVKVKVIDPLGRDNLNEEVKDEWYKHAIDEKKNPGEGTYKICFQNSHAKKTRVELRRENEISEAGPKEGMKYLEKVDELLKISEKVLKSLMDQMEETKAGESRDKDEHTGLRSRINMGSCFTMVVIISASAWQLILLNKFFRSKKLI